LAEVIRTRIYRLRHDATTSQRIGQLVSQQIMAYNRGVDILQAAPDIVLWPGKRNSKSFKAEISDWMKKDPRVASPAHILATGAEQVWHDDKRLKRQKGLDLLREDPESAETHERLRYRSRKHGPSVLTSAKPPVRISDDKLAFPGADDLILSTKEPVPELDIRSFRLVEVRSERHGANRPLKKRRYALHLNVVETYPDPPNVESVGSLDDVLGIEDCTEGRLVLSTGDFIDTNDSRRIRRAHAMRSSASHKKTGSKRQQQLLRQVRKAKRRQRAERRRQATETARVLLKDIAPKVLAVSPQIYRARRRPLKDFDALTNRQRGPLYEAVNTELTEAMIFEAQRQGIAIYTLLPQPSERNCNRCRQRDVRENQAESRCRNHRREPNSSLDTARDLQERAFRYIAPAASRTLYAEEPQMGRRVNPPRNARTLSCDTLGADKLTNDSGQIGTGPKLSPPHDLAGVSLQAGSSSEQGAQRQLVSHIGGQHIITDELIFIINMINDEDLAFDTKRNRAESMTVWATWATTNRQRVIPADPAAVACFLAKLAELGYSTQTILGHLKGVVAYHRLLGLDNPTSNQVRKVVAAIERLHGKWGRQAPGLSREDVKAIEAAAFAPLSRETPEQSRERGLKIVALVNLMRDCLLRRSEAASLKWRDISPYPDGAGSLLIRYSKTDRLGKGAALYISRNTMKALSAMRNGAGDDDSVFGWSADQISYRIKQAARRAGLDKGISTHSMRRGMAQELGRENASIEEISEAGRWDDDSTAVRYTLSDEPKESAVARFYALMQEEPKAC